MQHAGVLPAQPLSAQRTFKRNTISFCFFFYSLFLCLPPSQARTRSLLHCFWCISVDALQRHLWAWHAFLLQCVEWEKKRRLLFFASRQGLCWVLCGCCAISDMSDQVFSLHSSSSNLNGSKPCFGWRPRVPVIRLVTMTHYCEFTIVVALTQTGGRISEAHR